MRFAILVTLAAIFLMSACGTQTDSFVPDNDLWKEDGFINGDVTEAVFKEIIALAHEIYDPIATQWEETLTINAKWDDPTVNANASRDGQGWTEINMFGGLARRQEVIPEGFALVLCHELNHLYGGAPYIEPSVYMSAEGQSDWMGAGWCLKNIVEKLSTKGQFTPTEYMKTVCENKETCLRQLGAGISLGSLLSKLNGDRLPSYETPDKTVVKRTNTSYPKTTQCRVDTYLNGALKRDRPLCWFKP